MPQFWRVILVIERVTRDWGRRAFSVDDLLSAYNITRLPYNRYGLFPRGRHDSMLVHGTQVWKSRYVFVQTSSITDESWVVPEWNSNAVNFTFETTEESTALISHFLSYSVMDRTYRTSKGGEDSDVDPEVQVIEETDMEGSASKKTSVMEAAARAAKRKAAAGEDLVAKRTRSSYVSLDTPPKDAKRKAEGGIEAIPIHFAPPAKETGASSQPSSKVGKGKKAEGSGLTTMTISMPSDFMVDDVIRTKSIFPVLEQFHSPAQKARMEEADIEDLDAFVAGISFLALQTSLSLHSRMAKIKEEIAANQNDAKLAKKEAEKAKKKLAQLVDEVNPKSVQIGDLESKLEIGKLIIISNNCPPLRKSEIEYYAMLVEDHHYIEQVVSYVSFDSIKIDRYKQDSRSSYNLDINSQQYRWTVTLRALIEDNNVGRTMDNGFIASLQQQLQEANNEIQRLRALPGPSMTIPMSVPPPYPPQHLRPPLRPQFNASMPFSTVNQQYNNVRPSLPQFTPPIPHGPPPMPRGPPSMPQGAPMFTVEPFSQQIPIPGHIPTAASSTIHTTIPPSTGIASSCIPTNPINVEDPLNVRLKSLEEQNQKLFALLTKLPGAAVPVEVEPKTGFQASPFVDELALVDVPKKYTIPAFATKYSGITDPVEHIAQYKQLMWTVPIPAQYQEVCMCKSFGSTLTGAALQWLINLKPKSIGSFAELVNQFTRQFASSGKMEKQTSDLYYIVQKSGETIRDYFNRFNAAMIEIKNCDVKTAIEAYKRGLEDSSGLYLELTKYPPENFDDVRARTLAFMRIEVDALFRRKHSAEKKPLGAQKHDFKHKRVNKIGNPRYESKTRPGKGTVKIRYPELSTYNFAGTSKDLVDSLRKIDANVRWPKKSDKPGKDKDQNRWCDFHDDHGHTTDECISLKKEISYLKSKGHLKGLIPEEQGRPASPVHTKVVNCITGGSEVCGLTYSAAKRHARDGPDEHPIPGEVKSKAERELDAMAITFDQDDTQGVHHKHHDALVIQLTIGNCSTKRILIDGGSSANVIFADTLKVMGIERSEIVRRSTTLIGFNGDPMNTLGEIILPVFAKGINKQTKFNVVDCQSAYNVILGRPWIHEMKAIPSTYHQKIKFPSPWGIQEIASENKVARECYKITMKTKSQDI
ncbi:hypothetical protein OSB04_un000644 [Centaurea solstitialis]|uniref:Retrotransposon gag domain-containing protein n=1 Tax=Centaurea solstitialis TaxID=347529 RepID=A0AA38S5U6_9ASTR|nr:hypothetical protein OSB04_un000644 [Centaurea solstitialis]